MGRISDSERYGLPKTNARLEKLKEVAFANHAELYLWIPPSRPYYDLQGAYKGSQHFSKILVFSAWEMVPRMIGAMVSYEAERLTIGEVCNRATSIEKNNTKYYARRRYPYRRLQFTLKGSDPQRMTLFCLLYPSKSLADFYTPLQCINAGMSLAEIEREIREQIRVRLAWAV